MDVDVSELLVERHGHSETETHKMKTSATQFRILVDFMEEHGDFTKANMLAHDRISKNATWARLGEALNAVADFNGQSRSIEKWKKVWSDMKTNTKKKALKLVRKPADCQLRITQLEYRLLKIMNMIKTTPTPTMSPCSPASPLPALVPRSLSLVPGLPSPSSYSPPPQHEVVELTFENAFERKLPRNPLLDSPKAEPSKSIEIDDEFSWPKSPSPVSQQRIPLETSIELGDCPVVADCTVAVRCEPCDDRTTTTPAPAPAPDTAQETPPAPAPPRPDNSGHTTSRNAAVAKESRGGALQRLARALLRGEARRRREERARSLRDAALQRERLRLRARELKLQQKWQTICEHGLGLMERFLKQQGSARQQRGAPVQVPEHMERWTTVLLPRTPRPPRPPHPPHPPHPPRPAHPLILNPDRDQWST